MKSTPRVQFALLAAWALLILALMVLRPRPNEMRFWLLFGPGLLAGVGYMIWSRRESRRDEADVADWNSRLAAAVDLPDFEDDGHLHECFTPEERERLIQELERMPRGSRSLKKAIGIVSPEMIEENA